MQWLFLLQLLKRDPKLAANRRLAQPQTDAALAQTLADMLVDRVRASISRDAPRHDESFWLKKIFYNLLCVGFQPLPSGAIVSLRP